MAASFTQDLSQREGVDPTQAEAFIEWLRDRHAAANDLPPDSAFVGISSGPNGWVFLLTGAAGEPQRVFRGSRFDGVLLSVERFLAE